MISNQKNFYTAKEGIYKMKRLATKWEKVFASHIPDMQYQANIQNT